MTGVHPRLPIVRYSNELNAVVTSLSLGGAERIVVDWSARIYPRWRLKLTVLFDAATEWPVPPHVQLTRLGGQNIVEQLDLLGRRISKSATPVCITHLLTRSFRTAIARHRVHVIPVIHNSREGWDEDPSQLEGSAQVIAVSLACAGQLRESGWLGNISVIRHIPPRWNLDAELRGRYRTKWDIPANAIVVGMIGAVRPQKCYVRALRVFAAFLANHDAYLVIVGGAANAEDCQRAWHEILAEIRMLHITTRVILPGPIIGGATCLPAFDIFLNSSDFEGSSIATLEALVNKVPSWQRGLVGKVNLVALHCNSWLLARLQVTGLPL
jgi:glycosyltransferase involved in cell wall biosynthesis